MTRVDAISLQALQTENSKRVEHNSEKDDIGEILRNNGNKLKAERLKNVPKDIQEKYQEAKEILYAISNKYDKYNDFIKYPQYFVTESSKDGISHSGLRVIFSVEKALQEISPSEKSTYLKYKKVMENLEAQYPELSPEKYYGLTSSFEESINDIPAEKKEVQVPSVNDGADKIPQEAHTPVANEHNPENKLVKGLRTAPFGPILGHVINESVENSKDDNPVKKIIKAPLGVLGWLLP